MQKYIRRFSEIGIDDIPEVGGKNASLWRTLPRTCGRRDRRAGRICHHRRCVPPVSPTVQSRKDVDGIETLKLKQRGPVLITGRSIGEKIASGPVRVIQNAQFLGQFKPGEILVTDKTDPDWEPIMKIAETIVTNRGGRTCHAAIVSRELGVPAIVGTEHGTEKLTAGELVTVSCAEGDTGFGYAGRLDYEVQRTNLKSLRRPATKVMMNVGNPEEAFALSFLPNDGVGLAGEWHIPARPSDSARGRARDGEAARTGRDRLGDHFLTAAFRSSKTRSTSVGTGEAAPRSLRSSWRTAGSDADSALNSCDCWWRSGARRTPPK